MKSINYLLIIVFTLIPAVLSCKKEVAARSGREILTSVTWIFASANVNGIEQVLMDCDKDNTKTFYENGMYTNDLGAIKCDPGETTNTGTWFLSEDEKTLLLDGNLSVKVEITEPKLVITLVADPYTLIMRFIPLK